MGEAKRRRLTGEMPQQRTWATGTIEITANDNDCFHWTGTRQDAIDLQKRYLDTVNAAGWNSHSYAKRAAGYLICFGMPKAGDNDLRPSNLGRRWESNEITLYRSAVLWLVLREHLPNTGQKVEDIFVGKVLLALFKGDREQILDETRRELIGQPFSGKEFNMMVAVVDADYRLDPKKAVTISVADLLALLTGRCRLATKW